MCVRVTQSSTKFWFQRPTARDLLKHPFVRRAKKNNILIDIIERAAEYKTRMPHSDSEQDDDNESVNGGDHVSGFRRQIDNFLLVGISNSQDSIYSGCQKPSSTTPAFDSNRRAFIKSTTKQRLQQ